jgi:hypothetical protein
MCTYLVKENERLQHLATMFYMSMCGCVAIDDCLCCESLVFNISCLS